MTLLLGDDVLVGKGCFHLPLETGFDNPQSLSAAEHDTNCHRSYSTPSSECSLGCQTLIDRHLSMEYSRLGNVQPVHGTVVGFPNLYMALHSMVAQPHQPSVPGVVSQRSGTTYTCTSQASHFPGFNAAAQQPWKVTKQTGE